MNWADLLVIVIVLIFTVIGIKRGFVRSVLGVISIVISLLLAVWTYPVVSDIIENSGACDIITKKVESVFIEEKVNEAESGEEKEEKELVSLASLPKVAQKSIEESADKIKDSAAKSAAKSVSSLAVNILSILIVFLAVRLIMFILTHTLDFLTKLPILKGLNKLLGGIAGAMSGLFAVYLILMLLTFNLFSGTNVVIEEVKTSKIASTMYDNNFILDIIS